MSVENEQADAGRDGTAGPVSRDQILRRERGQGNIYFPCSADPAQDWQPHPVDPYSATSNDDTYIRRAYTLNRTVILIQEHYVIIHTNTCILL